MKRSFWPLGLMLVCLVSCVKKVETITAAPGKTAAVSSQPAALRFTEYLIKKGNQNCERNALVAASYSALRFFVRFDSSAVYKTVNPQNQYDINKLYGFSDNRAHHHEYSARFGWRFSDGALRLFAYVYNKGVRVSTELGRVQPGTTHECRILIKGNQYEFWLDGKATAVPRAALTPVATGYKLYPYFGGDEKAPHDVRILISER